jgi:hypothetical protein
MFVVVILTLIALACAGGLEAEGTEPIPSLGGFIAAMSCAALLLYNIIQCDRQGKK